MLNKCCMQKIKLQSKTTGSAENQAAVDNLEIGIYTPLSLNLMQNSVAMLDEEDAAEKWHKTFHGDHSIGLSEFFRKDRRPDLVNKQRNSDLSSYEGANNSFLFRTVRAFGTQSFRHIRLVADIHIDRNCCFISRKQRLYILLCELLLEKSLAL
nr:AlNc14C52G4081 [Albugo laibachii Nc14]|eukprot:CCA18565.1 AlNc14C52G4081 [Albugo laibachii Nc14]